MWVEGVIMWTVMWTVMWAEDVIMVIMVTTSTRGKGANGADGAVGAVGARAGAVAGQADTLGSADGSGWGNLAGRAGLAHTRTLGKVVGACCGGGGKGAGLAGFHVRALGEGADGAQLTLAHASCTVAGLAHTLAGEGSIGLLDGICRKAASKPNVSTHARSNGDR
jgi:hypothetical protein